VNLPLSYDNYYLGHDYTDEYILSLLTEMSVPYEYLSNPCSLLAKELEAGKVIALFNGRMEYGPRALGNRSILARPDNKKIKDFINSNIKGREWFRPFAPVVLEEYFSDLFDGKGKSPFMTVTFPVRSEWRSRMKGVVNTDFTSRVQTVSKEENCYMHEIISEFLNLTGIPALLNTSFNTRGRPIVMSPHDAIETFYSSPIDLLCFGNIVIKRKNIDEISPQFMNLTSHQEYGK